MLLECWDVPWTPQSITVKSPEMYSFNLISAFNLKLIGSVVIYTYSVQHNQHHLVPDSSCWAAPLCSSGNMTERKSFWSYLLLATYGELSPPPPDWSRSSHVLSNETILQTGLQQHRLNRDRKCLQAQMHVCQRELQTPLHTDSAN